MLIYDNPEDAKKLSPQEQLKRMYEDTDSRLQPYRLADQDDLTNAEKRMGKPMNSNELIRMVTKINPKIWAEDSNANPRTVAGFYTYTVDDFGEKRKVFLCAFEKGWLPEFSIVVEDTAGLPVKHRKGWRTVLVMLMEQHYLDFEDVVVAFGDALGMNSKNWASLTRELR